MHANDGNDARMLAEADDLRARDLAVLWHPCTQMAEHPDPLPLLPIRRGRDAWLEGVDGRRYLDAVSSWWVNLFGHGHPHIKAAIREQLDTLDHVMLAGFTHAPVVELSERLSAATGVGHAFYGSDEWTKGPRQRVLADIESYTTVVIHVDAATLAGLRRAGK